ncbi:DUF805 domain-containing protein [Salipiger mucosus]|uniref:Integral membrane protein n=1 Tax=Salipiger mucosus DSM 16094 TaxID=1123237 RepID=S9SKR3_9RHOB|nr:DUF805 domain-containing protein [Salipiger mucosus]EPX86964.1 hypothetical protein Salmuc_02939 [Salipiger mucosus DSM 16094]
MGFVDAVKAGFRNYVTFSGRASRPDFWWWALFIFAGSLVLSLVDAALFGVAAETGEARQVLSGLFNLGVLLPTMAVGFRRMHDSGRPGWYYLLPFLVSLGLMLVVTFGMATAVAVEGGSPGAGMAVGMAGLAAIGIAQIVLLVLMIWWLTRPSDPGTNAHGPPPT